MAEIVSKMEADTAALKKAKEDLDEEKQQIYFNDMYKEKRETFEREKDEFQLKFLQEKTEFQKDKDKVARDLRRIDQEKSEQEALLQRTESKLQTVEEEQARLRKMKVEATEEIALLDAHRRELQDQMDLHRQAEQDLKKSTMLQQEREKELQMQHEQIKTKYEQLEAWFEMKIRKHSQTASQAISEREELEKQLG